jgi:hypothetical protein
VLWLASSTSRPDNARLEPVSDWKVNRSDAAPLHDGEALPLYQEHAFNASAEADGDAGDAEQDDTEGVHILAAEAVAELASRDEAGGEGGRDAARVAGRSRGCLDSLRRIAASLESND